MFFGKYLDRHRIAEAEDEAHPKRSLACALISSICCPILGEWFIEHKQKIHSCAQYILYWFICFLGIIAIFYAIRAVQAQSQGFYAEATTFYKKAIRWSLITFIIGLVLGSIIAFIFFVKAVLFV